MPRSVVIDCDPGVDDAVALALALASPELDVLAVTTVAGNGPVELMTSNALRLLRLFGRDDIPVAAGADRGLVRARPHRLPSPHGDNGLGGVSLPDAVQPVRPEPAVQLLASVLQPAAPRSVTVIGVGPLTNIALLAAVYPRLLDRVAALVLMGGSREVGNGTPVTEFNIWTDPEAAARVLDNSGPPVTMVGLDVTLRATVDADMVAELAGRSDTGAALAAMIRSYGRQGPDGWPLHDALAVAAVIDPGVLRTRSAVVEVDTGPGPGRGQTVTVLDGAGRTETVAASRIEVAVDVDVARFRDLLLSRIGRPVPGA